MDEMEFFSDYMKCCSGVSVFSGKRSSKRIKVGILNGSSWINLWSQYFAKKYIPEMEIVCTGNDALQMDFMDADMKKVKCPTAQDVKIFVQYALDMVKLYHVNAVLITCSTMNRSHEEVQKALLPYHVPVFQIDRPMMEKALRMDGNLLVISTHGPTVQSTSMLIQEVKDELGSLCRIRRVREACVPEAFERLGHGDISGHNNLIRETIQKEMEKENYVCVVLAQLSMSVFSFSCPFPEKTFGIPVYNSAEEGFLRLKEVLSEA